MKIARSERAEGIELASAPNSVDLQSVLDLLFLHSLLVELGRNLLGLDQVEQGQIVKNSD